MAVKKAVTWKKTPTPSRTGAIAGNLGFMNLLTKKEVKHNMILKRDHMEGWRVLE
jgi:hypothetical protein